MHANQQNLEKLAEALAAKVSRSTEPNSRPRLRLIEAAKPTIFDSITRDCILKRVRFLRRSYRLDWLVEQASFNHASLDCLPDEQLSSLLKDMEAARECIAEGIPFEDADLVRSTALHLPDEHD